jgi:hypothetical protein
MIPGINERTRESMKEQITDPNGSYYPGQVGNQTTGYGIAAVPYIYRPEIYGQYIKGSFS